MLLLAWPVPAQPAAGDLSVNLVIPGAGAVFPAPANFSIIAKAVDSSGTVTNVQFFSDGSLLGNGAVVVLDPPGVNGVVGPVDLLNWSSVPQGSHVLTAVASDNNGVNATSPPVSITVLVPPVMNPPLVSGTNLVIGFSVLQATKASFSLLQTPNLAGPWTTNTTAVLTTNAQTGTLRFSIPMPGSVAFFQVRSP